MSESDLLSDLMLDLRSDCQGELLAFCIILVAAGGWAGADHYHDQELLLPFLDESRVQSITLSLGLRCLQNEKSRDLSSK